MNAVSVLKRFNDIHEAIFMRLILLRNTATNAILSIR